MTAWPCEDTLPYRCAPPIGAVALGGLTVGGTEPGPAARQCAERLDLSVFDYLEAGAFEDRYGALVRQIAIRIRVRDLARTAEVLDRRGVRHAWRETELIVAPPPPLGCAFAFSE
jgi:hypothetical protein